MAQNNPHVTLIILTTHVWGKILLPSARHLEEGRGTTEAGKVHMQVVPQPAWEPPPPPTSK